jgi:hypothetical protein
VERGETKDSTVKPISTAEAVIDVIDHKLVSLQSQVGDEFVSGPSQQAKSSYWSERLHPNEIPERPFA